MALWLYTQHHGFGLDPISLEGAAFHDIILIQNKP